MNAPHMTARDAARITLALLATDKPSMAVERFKRFASIPYSPSESQGPHPEKFEIKHGTTFEEVLTAIFAADETVFETAPYVEIQENARSASIKHSGGIAVFRDAERTTEQKETDRHELFGIRRGRGLASYELASVHLPLLIERRDGKTWERAPTPMETVAALLAPLAVKWPPEGED